MAPRLAALVLAALAAFVQAQPMTQGEVRKVDAAQKKIILKHGEIRHLDMPAMSSMAFSVKDPALLGRVKPGDKVRFAADKLGLHYTVTAIEVIE